MDTLGWIVLALCVIGLGLICMACFEQAAVADAQYDAMVRQERHTIATEMVQEYHASENAKIYEEWLAEQDYTQEVAP